jgi:hypothetical protein
MSENNDLHETLRRIKEQFRLSMNGPASTSMREKGVEYKVNFGVELPRIRTIAEPYGQDHHLAQALWKEDVRECKIMASMVQPTETFYREIADLWIEQMHTEELAEYTTLQLFQRLPYASDAAFCWMADERPMFQYCGFLLITRLFMKGGILNERSDTEYLDQAATALRNERESLRRAARNSLLHYAEIDDEHNQRAEAILNT